MAQVLGYRTTGIEEISVRESAYHTTSNRFYHLEADDYRGWRFPFDELHHKKVIIVNIGMHKDEKARESLRTLAHISNEISPYDGTRILAFPCDQFLPGDKMNEEEMKAFLFHECGIHPNDTSFKIMAQVQVDGPQAHPVFAFLKSMTGITAIGKDFGAYFYINRNAHIQGVADSAAAILSVLQSELPTTPP